MKKMAWLLVAACSLVLPNVAQTIWGSLESGEWQISWYNLGPRNTFVWLVCSAAIIFSARMSACWYANSGKLFRTIFLGTLFSAGALLLAETCSSLLVVEETYSSWWETISVYATILTSRPALVSHILTGLAATLVGIWLGGPIASPERDSRAVKTIARLLIRLAERILGQEKVRRTRLYWRMQA